MAIKLIEKTNTPVTEKTGQLRVAFYMRVSTAEQELEGYSPEFQKEQLLEHVKRKEYKGWVTKPEWHFYEQASGGDMEGRKELSRLLELVRAGEVDLVLVWKIDRLSRNLSDLLNLFEEFDKHGVGFASMKEDLDFTGVIGKLIFQIFGALAEFERGNIKMRTEEGRKASALAGNYTGGTIPYGYKDVPNLGGKGKKLALVPEEAKIVQQIFEWFVQGDKNAAWIVRELDRLGVAKGQGNRRAKGTKWRETTIRTMLGSEEYRGVFITNRYYLVSKKPRRHAERPKQEWITVRIPPIVDDMLYYMAQEKLQRTSVKPVKGGGKESYMLRGKIIEVGTNRGFVGYIATKGTKNYRRKQYVENSIKVSSISIAAKPLEDFVWSYIEKAINHPDDFLKIHERRMSKNNEKEKLIEQLHFYEDQLSDLNKKIERVNEDYYAEHITDQERQDYQSKYKDQREAALQGKQKAEADLMRLGTYNAACEHLREFSAKFRRDAKAFTYEQKKKLVDMLVERIEITDDAQGRGANVLFRFDPKEIAATIPQVEPSLLKQKPKMASVGAKTVVSGASDGA